MCKIISGQLEPLHTFTPFGHSLQKAYVCLFDCLTVCLSRHFTAFKLSEQLLLLFEYCYSSVIDWKPVNSLFLHFAQCMLG